MSSSTEKAVRRSVLLLAVVIPLSAALATCRFTTMQTWKPCTTEAFLVVAKGEAGEWGVTTPRGEENESLERFLGTELAAAIALNREDAVIPALSPEAMPEAADSLNQSMAALGGHAVIRDESEGLILLQLTSSLIRRRWYYRVAEGVAEPVRCETTPEMFTRQAFLKGGLVFVLGCALLLFVSGGLRRASRLRARATTEKGEE